jgi:hypothetical protein
MITIGVVNQGVEVVLWQLQRHRDRVGDLAGQLVHCR